MACILLLTGVPSFQQFTFRQHMKAALASLHNDLMMARSEAVYRNMRVVSCPGQSSDGMFRRQRLERRLDRFADSNADRQRQQDEDNRPPWPGG